jgi:hypothetical protein
MNEQLAELAQRAWWYGYPLVVNLEQIERYVTTGVGANPATTFNAFSHASHLATPADTFVSINNDTVYSMGPIDLSAGPLLFEVPDTAGAYYVFQFIDAWTNNFAYVGTRATGTGAGRFLLTPPGWNGRVPDGTTQIRFPTRIGHIVGRWACDSTDDLARVTALQQATSLTPLDPAPVAGIPPTGADVPETLQFWEKLRVWMAAFPPPARDFTVQERFGPLGLLDESSPYRDGDSELAATLVAAAGAASAALTTAIRSMGAGAESGWHLALHMTDYNADYFEVGTIDSPDWKITDRADAIAKRAEVALGGLWGNHGYEAAYAITYLDDRGEQLSGERTYTLTLEPPPPAQAFWSLTMYDMPHYYLVGNPIDRYSIGDRTPGIVSGPNASITIVIAHQQPDDPTARANWLPAPAGPFRPCLRMYIPGTDLTEGRYNLPPITRTA